MKRFIATFLLCFQFWSAGFSQDSLYLHLPLEEGRVVYTRIFEVAGISKADLITKIKDWSVDSYNSQKAALQIEDKEAGYIAFKGYLPITLLVHGGVFNGNPYDTELYHTLKFYVKDSKIKVVFCDLELSDQTLLSQTTLSRTPVEKLGDGLEKFSTKKREKYTDSLQRDAKRMNRLIGEFLASMEKKLTSGKSAFDF